MSTVYSSSNFQLIEQWSKIYVIRKSKFVNDLFVIFCLFVNNMLRIFILKLLFKWGAFLLKIENQTKINYLDCL